jgi:hypothetical protein
MGRRTADPWADTDVIDARAPRFNQVIVGLVALLGAFFGWPLAWALMALQLFIGLTAGRRYCLTCLAYFVLVQPRFGEGPLEDSRPPRLANVMGCAFLSLAALAWWLGATTAGIVLAAIVAALALLAAGSGFCTGCEIYKLTARLRGVSAGGTHKLDPADLNGASEPETIVEFTHPLCAECREWEGRLTAGTAPFLKLDVRERPDLAHKYGIAVVPTVLVVDPSGTVLRRLAP